MFELRDFLTMFDSFLAFIFGFALVRLTWSMYYLTNFHADYPYARVIVGNCGDTVSLSCNINIDNVSLPVGIDE